MSEENRPGLLTGLLLGTGFAGILILPLILMRRFGITVMTLITTVGMSVFAGVQPYVHDWAVAAAAECSGLVCAAEALANLVGALPSWGWWALAMTGWGLVILRYKLGFTSDIAGDRPN